MTLRRAAFAAILFLFAREAGAVIVLPGGDRMTPPSTGGIAGLASFEGMSNDGKALTAINSQWFVGAKHNGGPSSITYQGAVYQVTEVQADPNSDLELVKIDGTLSNFASIYRGSSETGQEMAVFGYGWGTLTGNPLTSVVTIGGIDRGWYLSTAPQSTLSYGTDVVSGYAVDDQNHPYLYFTFQNDGDPHALLTGGDSGGGLFIRESASSPWMLAGVNYAVDAYKYSTSPDGSNPFIAGLYNQDGLYGFNGDDQTFAVSGPNHSYATQIAGNLGFIDQFVPTTVPEPTSLVLLGVGIVVGLGWRRVRKTGSRSGR